MRLNPYTTRDLQTIAAVLADAATANINLSGLSAAVATELMARSQDLAVSSPSPASRLRPDNLTTCAVCGKPAVIVPLSRVDRSVDATHAIQCQNRPATDHPWRDGMCGHTEYIVRGDK